MNRKCCVRTATQVLAVPQPVHDGSTTRRLRRSNTSAAFGSAGSWSTTYLPEDGDIPITFPGRGKELAPRRAAETRDASAVAAANPNESNAAHALDRRRRALTCSPLLEIGWRSASTTPLGACLDATDSVSTDCSEGAVSNPERPAGSDRQRCPACDSITVLFVSVVDGRVWFVCGKCSHRWSIQDRRAPKPAPYEGPERRGGRLLW
jgi:hypothetical protein